MKLLNLFFFVFFLVVAALQMNDPDPFWWIALYVAAAWLSLRASKNNYSLPMQALLVVIALTWAGYITFIRDGVKEWVNEHSSGELVQKMQADQPWIEETREVAGLLILVAVGTIQFIVAIKHKKSAVIK